MTVFERFCEKLPEDPWNLILKQTQCHVAFRSADSADIDTPYTPACFQPEPEPEANTLNQKLIHLDQI